MLKLMQALFSSAMIGSKGGGGERTVQVEGANPTIEPENNTWYECGVLESLVVDNAPAQGAYSIVFFTGATAADCTFDDTLHWPGDGSAPSIEANRRYEINVKDSAATFQDWPWPSEAST